MNERQNIIKQHDSMTKKIKSVAEKFSLFEEGKTDLVERDKDIEKECEAIQEEFKKLDFQKKSFGELNTEFENKSFDLRTNQSFMDWYTLLYY